MGSPTPKADPGGLARRCSGLLGRCGLLDRRCSLCGEAVPPCPQPRLCPACQELLAPRRKGYCPLCGEMHAGTQITPCPNCLDRQSGRKTSLPWQGLCFYAPYAGVLRAAILAFKVQGRLGLAALLQALLLEGWRNNGAHLPRPDIIAPVPLHPKRLRLRGFNQSIELARPLARQLRLPLTAGALTRIRPTVPQFQLDPSQRASNIRGAFVAAPVVRGKAVLLVDDIMTTGATLEECGRVLRQAGACRVDVLVLARTARV